MLEQGLALDELVGIKTSRKREAHGDFRGDQSPPTASVVSRGAVPHHRLNSPMVKVVFLKKVGNPAAAEAPR